MVSFTSKPCCIRERYVGVVDGAVVVGGDVGVGGVCASVTPTDIAHRTTNPVHANNFMTHPMVRYFPDKREFPRWLPI
jgi:hypothetical protein